MSTYSSILAGFREGLNETGILSGRQVVEQRLGVVCQKLIPSAKSRKGDEVIRSAKELIIGMREETGEHFTTCVNILETYKDGCVSCWYILSAD